MAIHFLSADHRHLGLGTVARLGAVAPHLGPDLLAAPLGLRGALVLSTCNRLALLLDTGDADATEGADSPRPDGAVAALLAQRAGLPADCLRLVHWQGRAAHRELFATACGLRSMVVGERQTQ